MKLNDLIKSTEWLSVEITLKNLYPDQVEMIDEYRKVYEKLRLLEPEDYDMDIVLTEIEEESLDSTKEPGTYVSVSGRKKHIDENTPRDSYALEFTGWRKWLGMGITPETTKNFTEPEIIAHCLYEMTFIGFEEEEIKEQFKLLKDEMEEFDKMTDEEKKENTITLEELEKKLNKKGDKK